MGVAAALMLAAAGAWAGATLRVCDDVGDPMTLDPHKQFSEKNHTLVQQIFEGLVRFDAEGNIVPALALSWERLGPRRMRFSLRRGVRFHNGEPFDAAAVRFSIERYLAPQTRFPAFGYINTIAGAEVVDRYTVDIRTHHPDGLLLNRLAGFILIVAPRHYRETAPETLRERPVGTGPFRLQRWERGRAVVLFANERYWRAGVPRVDRLEFRFIPIERQVSALLAGEVDILTNLPGTRTTEVYRHPHTDVVKKRTFYTVAGNFNTARGPLADPKVREAINIAVDRSSLIRYDIFGNGAPVATLSMPGEFGHNDALPLYPFDAARAKRLLRASGYPDGFTLKVLLKTNAARTGRILSKQLARVGVRLQATLVTDAELFEALADKSEWDVAIYDCPDPMHHAFFIRSIFLSGKSPFALAPDAEVDRFFERIVAELDPEEQARISRELDRLIRERHLALPTYQRLRTYGIRKGVRFTPYLSGMPYFHETAVSGASHEEKTSSRHAPR